MRLRTCSHIGCHTKLPIGTTYCDKHKALHNTTNVSTRINQRIYNQEQRNQEANTFYHSKQWTKMREYVYTRDMGMCQITNQPILNDGRFITDHVHPLSIAPDEKLDSNNLWLLSTEAHNVKTMIEQQLLNSPNGKNKAKHVSKEWYKKRVLIYMAKQRSVKHEQTSSTNGNATTTKASTT